MPLAAIQEAQKAQPSWLNTPGYIVTNDKEANVSLRDWLGRGVDALYLRIRQQPDLAALLHGIKLSETPVFLHIQPETADFDTVRLIRDLKTVAPYQLKGSLMNAARRLTSRHNPSNFRFSPSFELFCIDSRIFHNAGRNGHSAASIYIGFTR